MVDLVNAMLGLWCGAHLAFTVAIALDTPSEWKAARPHREDEAGDLFIYIYLLPFFLLPLFTS